MFGTSVTGRSHHARGTPGQDHSGWAQPPGRICLAIADGAGSRRHAAIGADLAVRTVLDRAAGFPTGGLVSGSFQRGRAAVDGRAATDAWLRGLFVDVRVALVDRAAAGGADPADYACTLSLAILTRHSVHLAQIGDGLAVVGVTPRQGPASFQTVQPAPRSEYVNETSFVTDAHLDVRLTRLPAATIDSVFLSTDGLRLQILADPWTSQPYPPFFADVTAYARGDDPTSEELGQFLEQLDDQTGDDKTLVAAVRTRARRHRSSRPRRSLLAGRTPWRT